MGADIYGSLWHQQFLFIFYCFFFPFVAAGTLIPSCTGRRQGLSSISMTFINIVCSKLSPQSHQGAVVMGACINTWINPLFFPSPYNSGLTTAALCLVKGLGEGARGGSIHISLSPCDDV